MSTSTPPAATSSKWAVSSTEDKWIRKIFQKKLSGSAAFLRLKNDSKKPISSFSSGHRNRLKNIPKDGNFGIIPLKDLFIIDFDRHRKNASNLEEQIDFFSEFFGIDLRKSLMVETQTGGIHIYLKLPKDVRHLGFSFPRGSLRGVWSDAFSQVSGNSIVLDADIRSGLSNGYVVGPTTRLPEVKPEDPSRTTIRDSYIIVGAESGVISPESLPEILTISEDSLESLQKVVETAREIRQKIESSDTVEDSLLHTKPDAMTIGHIRTGMNARKLNSFHEKRAFVKAALHCCYDDYSIALTCIFLGIDKDSYSKKSIGMKNLLTDLKRLKLSSCYHGPYCRKTRLERLRERSSSTSDSEIKLEKLQSLQHKVKSRTLARTNAQTRIKNPRVLNVAKIAALLAEDKRTNTQQFADALQVVDFFLQPLSNVGATRILLSYSALMSFLNFSRSRASQSLRLLRQAGVIEIEQKQRTGLATTYSIPENFTHYHLTRILRGLWIDSPQIPVIKHRPIFFERVTGNFVDVFDGSILKSRVNIEADVSSVNSGIPENLMIVVGAGAAPHYLREEAEILEALKNNGLEKDSEQEQVNASENNNPQTAILNTHEDLQSSKGKHISCSQDDPIPLFSASTSSAVYHRWQDETSTPK